MLLWFCGLSASSWTWCKWSTKSTENISNIRMTVANRRSNWLQKVFTKKSLKIVQNSKIVSDLETFRFLWYTLSCIQWLSWRLYINGWNNRWISFKCRLYNCHEDLHNLFGSFIFDSYHLGWSEASTRQWWKHKKHHQQMQSIWIWCISLRTGTLHNTVINS